MLAWVLMLGCLVVALPPLLTDLGGRDSTHTMENIALLSSQEVFLRQHGWHDLPADPDAWLMPTRNGVPRLEKPPLLVWLHLLAWADLEPATADAALLTHRARLVAAAMGLLTIAATFWAGASLGSLTTATIAALVLASSWFVQRQGRTASYDIHVTAWATLALAALLWTVHGGRLRLILGGLLAGTALGCAWLTKGPLALVLVLLPAAAAAVALPAGRRRFAGATLAAAVVAAAVALPWYVYVYRHVPGGESVLLREYRGPQHEAYESPLFYLAVFGLIAPWSLWLVSGLLHPFVGAAGATRRRRLVPWLWFLVLVVFFMIPSAKAQRYILPAMPAAALLAARVLADHRRLAAAGRPDPGARWVYVPHYAGLIAASIGGPVALALRLHEPFVVPLQCTTAAALAAALLGLSVLGLYMHHRRRHPDLGAVLTALWGVLLFTALWVGYAGAPSGRHPVRPEAERFAQVVGADPVRYVDTVGGPTSLSREYLNEEFMFYSRRIMPVVTPDALPAPNSVWLLVDDTSEAAAVLRAQGRAEMSEPFLTDKDRPMRLWR